MSPLNEHSRARIDVPKQISKDLTRARAVCTEPSRLKACRRLNRTSQCTRSFGRRSIQWHTRQARITFFACHLGIDSSSIPGSKLRQSSTTNSSKDFSNAQICICKLYILNISYASVVIPNRLFGIFEAIFNVIHVIFAFD